MKRLSSVKKLVSKNKQLFIGLAIGALVMLPTGLYVNERNSSRQANQGNTTLETKVGNVSSNAQGLNPVTGQPTPTQNSNQPSTNSSKPTSTYKAPVCTETPLPQNTTYYVNLRTGQTSAGTVTIESNGIVGYTRQCTADSNGYKPDDFTRASVNKRIGVGDGGATYATPKSNWWESYETVYARVAPACDELAVATSNDPIANQWCVTNIIGAIMRYFGY